MIISSIQANASNYFMTRPSMPFPWGYNETSPDCVMLKEVLAEQIKTLVDDGVTGFISGMAQGVDMIFIAVPPS